MIVLIGIALILLLLPVLKPADHQPSARSSDREDVRAATELQFFR